MSPKNVLPVHYGNSLASPGIKKPPSPRHSTILITVGIVFLLLWHSTFPEHGILDLLSKESTRKTSPSNNPILLIKARKGAVASQNKHCSEIGVNVLKGGGNAVDAAVSAVLCIGVVSMYSSGIGGGGFMTIRIPRGPGEASEAWTIDFRETAPHLANSTMFNDNPLSAIFGGLSVGVPGEMRGLQEAHRRWGKVPWKKLVEPSIALAKGWKVDKELERRILRFSDFLLINPDWSSIFAPNGRLLREGNVIRRTNLSRTLSYIAEHGPDAFYKGHIAESIVRKVQSTGGILSHADLEDYRVKVQPALEGSYHGRRIMTTQAPTGPVLLHMLNVLEDFDLANHNGLNVHRMVEATKFGFAARTRICDPDFKSCDVFKIASKEYAAQVAANVTDDRTHPSEYYRPDYDMKQDHGTSHTSVVDSNGMAVSITSTINLVFGSLVMDPETGIILNDEMDDFSITGVPNAFGLWPSPYNYPEAGKRPVSSTAPTIIENSDGSLHLVVGGAGGSRIFGAVLQVILNVDWGMDIGQAIGYARLHDQLYPAVCDVEEAFPSDLREELRARGHNVTTVEYIASIIQGIATIDGFIYAASDHRNLAAVAAGY